MKRMRGAALLWVLWILMIGTTLVVIGLQVSASNSAYASLARRHSQANALADAGLALAVWRLDARSGLETRWQIDNAPQMQRIGNADVAIRITDEAAKIDLNLASEALLAAYFKACGQADTVSEALAGAIVDYRDNDSQPSGLYGAEVARTRELAWRDPANHPFQAVDELANVLGISDDVLTHCLDDLSIHAGRSVPGGLAVSDTVQMAMAATGLTPSRGGSDRDSGIYRIDVQVRQDSGGGSSLQAVIRLAPFDPAGRGYRVLSWQRGALDEN